ncbi:CHAT domain-containing protein [Spirochaetota bacterium]
MIDKKLIKKWQVEKSQKDRHKFYEENIMPEIISILEEQVLEGEKDKKIEKYKNLILILTHNANPSIILASALKPEFVTVIYTPDKENLITKKVDPHLKKVFHEDGIEYIELDRMSHENNFKIMEKTVKKNKKKYKKVLCDITGGKKIISTQLGIIAHNLKLDLCYLDAPRYIESSVPFPGEEILYIQNSSSNDITEIKYSPHNSLKIGFSFAKEATIFYDLIMKNESLNFRTKTIKDSEVKSFAEKMNEKCTIVNSNIENEKMDFEKDLLRISNLIRPLLIPNNLHQKLGKMNDEEIRLILDEEVTGIPWEIYLSKTYNISLPILRIPHKNEEFVDSENTDKREGVLLIRGSGSEIPNFDSYINSMQIACSTFSPFKFLEARNRDELKMHLAENSTYRIILYFGHAEFDENSEKTGWVCNDGSIFDISALEVLYDNAPEIIIANACQSARAIPFRKNSFAYGALKSGCDTYIGTNWFLEIERSKLFLMEMIDGLLNKEKSTEDSFRNSLNSLRKKFGDGDISIYNYVYYGK